MLDGDIHINLRGLTRFAAALMQDPPPPAIVRCLKQWAARYRSFAQQEFNRKSKGTGWEPLKPATIARRRKGKKSPTGKQARKLEAARNLLRQRGIPVLAAGSVATLKDTGLLFAALNPELNTRGGFERYPGGFAVTVGYGGPTSHKKGRVSIADLAAIHHKGLGHVPPRPIIINPTAAIKAQMADDAQRALNRLAEGS